MSTRRGFLRLIGVSPVALPVAAKQAAVAMGLGGPVGSAVGILGGQLGYENAQQCNKPYPDGGWIRQKIQALHSPQKLAEFREQARHVARLDPDIAALRSISPATAYQMQVEREVQRMIRNEKGWLERQLFDVVGTLG